MRTFGIDLGTTNTVAAVEATVIQHASGMESSPILPSVVAFPPSGATLVGVTARKRRAIDPKNTLSSTKRLMGQRFQSPIVRRFAKQYPYDLVQADAGGCAFVTRAGVLTPVDVARRIVEKVFAQSPAQVGHTRAVVTVPAAFDNAAREATLEAARAVGLAEVQVLEEPVATAIAYATIHADAGGTAVVYDLGGGTFDVAVLDTSATTARVVCHDGDPYLGGDDLDQAIAQWAAQQVLERHGWDLRDDLEVYDRLVVQCERAKVRLGFAAKTRIDLSQIDPAAPCAGEWVGLEKETLQDLCAPLVSRSFLLCDQVLRHAGIRASDVDAVYLAGGASLLPSVREGVARYFGKLPRADFDPMEVVAIGASLAPT